MRIIRTGLLLAGLWSILLVPAEGQIQFPGEPFNKTDRLKAAGVMYLLPPVDPMEIEAALAGNRQGYKKPLQFAIERAADLSPEMNGVWTTTDGYRVWRVHILSPGAFSLGLVFNTFRLEPGVKVFVYDPDLLHVRGAYTEGNNKSSGILAVGHTPGEELVIEMQVPEGTGSYGSLRIESLSHGFLDPRQMSAAANCNPGEFGCSQVCEVDINCPPGDNWQLAKRSVVRIFTTTQYCSGVLVNNTAYDGTPYVLTAEHCINSEYYADRSVFLFNYESPSCGGPDGPLDMSVSGSDNLAVGDSLDFSLVRLSQAPPESYDVYFAGWDRSDFQTTASWTIHHPWGDVKKISRDNEIPSIPQQPGDVPYTDLDDYHYYSFWWIRGWDMGSTEGGSSGSPLFNGSKRVIGLLSGGIARCGDSIGFDPETQQVIYNQAFNYDDYYTRMSLAWDHGGTEGTSLHSWLDPLDTKATTIGGYHPTGTGPALMEEASRFTLYPNPVSGILRVYSALPGERTVSYRIMDLNGRMIERGVLENGGESGIDTAPFVPGIYFIRLDSSGRFETHKFIVSR